MFGWPRAAGRGVAAPWRLALWVPGQRWHAMAGEGEFLPSAGCVASLPPAGCPCGWAVNTALTLFFPQGSGFASLIEFPQREFPVPLACYPRSCYQFASHQDTRPGHVFLQMPWLRVLAAQHA